MNEQLNSIYVVSVEPCMKSCFIVYLEVNGRDAQRFHVDSANNPYHAINKQIKQLCADYSTPRDVLSMNGGLTYAPDYDAGWTYKGGNEYTYCQPEEPKVEPVNTNPQPVENGKHMFSITNRAVFEILRIEPRDDKWANFNIMLNEFHPTRQHLNLSYPIYALSEADALDRFRKVFGANTYGHGIIVDSRPTDQVDEYATLPKQQDVPVDVRVVVTVNGKEVKL